MALRLVCPCIHPVEGENPHEITVATDYYEKTEKGKLVSTSESSNM